MKATIVFAFLLAGLALLGLRMWSRRDAIRAGAPKGNDLSIIIDNSSSQHIDCGEIAGLVRAGLGDIQIGKGSTLTVYTLGSEANGFEPVPRINMALERGSGGVRKALRAVERACKGFDTVDGSSIFRAVQVGLNQMQSRGGKGSRLWLRSDGQENQDRRLFLKHGKAAILDNTGIETMICGVASTTEGGGPRGAQVDALIKVWRAAFMAPDQVKIQPFCPGMAPQASR